MKTGAELITDERERQKSEEGWSSEHDAQWTREELVFAACTYALKSNTTQTKIKLGLNEGEILPNAPRSPEGQLIPWLWPHWDYAWYKPCPDDRIRELVKAGALIAAEIDRLQAWEAKPE